MTGTVLWYNKNELYGFIKADDPNIIKDIYITSKHLDYGYVPEKGDRVKFRIANTINNKERPWATYIGPINEELIDYDDL